MKLRKLQVVGFKSFADPVRLQFRDGTTGIIGPNGCGKSNVVDAIRWVMGEQSPRRLRGKSMEDIIFSGSESKPPTGMAEVVLTFENDGRNVAPEYSHLPEISVGRRLFRSGESEYFINKTPCRLRDVQELFMGTGTGTRAYSIIGQGSIGLLVAQSPAERRGLIEEVAGISKYNSRKRLAENKMERTRQNLLRVNDILGELQRSLNSLKRQARKAARYHKVRRQLQELELHRATHRYLELGVLRDFRQRQQQRLQDEQSAHKARLAGLEADVEQGRVRLLEDERALSELQEKLYAADNQLKLCEKNIEFLGREIESLQGGGQQASEELQRLRGELEALEGSWQQAEQRLETLRQNAERAELRFRHSQDQYQRERQALEECSRRREQLQAQQRSLGERQVEVRARLEALQNSLVELQGAIAQSEAESQALQQSRQQLQGNLQQQSQRLEQSRQLHLNLVNRRQASQEELTGLQLQAKENEARLAALGAEIARRRSRLESLLQIERNYEGCHQGVQWVMKHARSAAPGEAAGEDGGLDVVGLVADLLRAPPRYETAVQAVLGERLQSVVVRSQQAGLQAVDVLKRQAEGRSSFIPLSLRDQPSYQARAVSGPKVLGPMNQLVECDEQYRSIVDHLLGDVVVVEDLPAAMAIWSANGHRATLVTLEGDVLEPQGVLTGGSLEGAGAHLLKNKRQIRELEQSLQQLEAEYRMAQDRQGKLKAELAMMQAALEELRQNTHSEELRIIDQEKDLGHLKQQQAGLDERLQQLAQQIERQQHKQQQLLELRGQLQSEQTEAERQSQQLEQQLEQLQSQLQERKRVVAALNQEVLDLKVEAAASAEKLEAARQNSSHLQQRRQELQQRHQATQQQISSGNQRLLECREKVSDNRQEISRLLDEKERLQADYQQARSEYDSLAARLTEQEQELKSVRQQHAQTADQLAELATSLRELELEQLHLVADTRRMLRCELSEHLHDYHLLPPPGPQQQAQADKLRAALDRMGDVNPNAMEEYEQQLQRFDFLSGQSRDLSEALEKLQKVIVKINRTSRKRFREAFEAVSERFEKVFPRLFNGGRAHLQLEPDKDLLEAGVEIVAQPPGKKLQNMELLSGGEKALTAVALLFSLFLVKPTPFCLLDEVDAPLDDANLDRFNRMVKQMSASSQFVIITHSKRTMEMVDQLYGITMEEPGISKVVSVRLSNPEQEQALEAVAS